MQLKARLFYPLPHRLSQAADATRQTPGRTAQAFFLCVLLMLLSGCATFSDQSQNISALILPEPAIEQELAYVPAFLIDQPENEFNRIGTPTAVAGDDNVPEIIVSPEKPIIYFGKSTFSTVTATYRNIIYRVHFSKVPFGWGQFNLTAGKNPGILVIYTLNEENTLVLVTTIHTCGCYLAFLPTEALPPSAYPEDWPKKRQKVYGQVLPARLEHSSSGTDQTLVFALESETHRISNIFPLSEMPNPDAEIMHAGLQPFTSLYNLPFGNTSVSFFETSGDREGYVKNNTKWLEKFFIGWWAFDFRVGEDKAYGGPDQSPIRLYTSLKFWARDDSDLKNFPQFLEYWGWKL